jgi:predicted O-methyltransferase YrrM
LKCPNCQSTEIRKQGFYRGKQRYQCKLCARQFVPTNYIDCHDRASTGVEENIDRYTRSLSTPLSDLAIELHKATALFPLAAMQPSLVQMQTIVMLSHAIDTMRIVEIGTFCSYSTLALAQALPGEGQLIGCGVPGEHLELSRSYWERGGVAQQINFSNDSGLEVLNRLATTYGADSCDLIVLSGLKHQYLNYYHQAIELLRPQGLLIATDVLWQGRVLNPQVYNDEFTLGLDRFNRELAADRRIQVNILPIGDGLTIAVKL